MNKKETGKIKIGNPPVYKVLDLSSSFGKMKRFFGSKSSLMVMVFTIKGDIDFYLVNVKKGKIELNGGLYWIKQDKILKTNKKYNIIGFHEDNPIPIDFTHKSNNTITATQFKKFMESALVDMAFKASEKKKSGGLGVVGWVIIIVVFVIMIIIALAVSGVVDINSFIMPRGTR